MDLKVSLGTAAAFVVIAIIVSGFTKIWLWPVGTFCLGISAMLFGFKLNKAAFIGLGISSVLLLVAMIFFSGWLIPPATPQ